MHARARRVIIICYYYYCHCYCYCYYRRICPMLFSIFVFVLTCSFGSERKRYHRGGIFCSSVAFFRKMEWKKNRKRKKRDVEWYAFLPLVFVSTYDGSNITWLTRNNMCVDERPNLFLNLNKNVLFLNKENTKCLLFQVVLKFKIQ